MDKNKDNQKEKTPAIETFPTDETPTPTKILRLADMDLFHDLKENPFDAQFRRATDMVRRGADSLSASMAATDIPADGETEEAAAETLNTPQIFCSEAAGAASPARAATRPVILRTNSSLRPLPTASVQPVKTFKPIAPAMPAAAGPDNAMLLLKFPGGETIKLSNLPFVKAEEGGTATPAVQQETKLKLKRVLSGGAGPSAVACSSRPPLGLAEDEAEEGRSELKERNRMSAQRSRLKKRQQLDMMADTCSAMQRHNSALTAENKELKAEIVSLKELLGEHLNCSLVHQRPAARQAVLALMAKPVSAPAVTADLETRTQPELSLDLDQGEVEDGEQEAGEAPVVVQSPPQTQPEDLRVAARLRGGKDEEPAPAPAPAPAPQLPVTAVKSRAPEAGEPARSLDSVRQTLARHCHKVGTERETKNAKKGVVAKRLKDKLEILKQKMAEDENSYLELKTGKR